MTARIFISHAGPDSEKAISIADYLEKAGLEVVIDRATLAAGDSIISFMEAGLRDATYCLLLWSKAASTRPWVQLEWEAALYRAVQEARGFLVVGRLEDLETPVLLAPRLRVDLFPRIESGLDQLIGTWKQDRRAAEQSSRPVGSAKAAIDQDPDGKTVYLSSELFGLTLPLQLALEVPTGLHLDHIVNGLQLPVRMDYQGRIGLKFDYSLVLNGQPLLRTRTLAAQHVRAGDVLELQVRVSPFSSVDPVTGSPQAAVFRGAATGELSRSREIDPEGLSLLRAAVTAAGLGA